jgi:EmrB/QacA subfamily drug resistance transporter
MSDLPEDPVDGRTGQPSKLVPLIIAASFFIEELDSTIITTSLPRMAEGLGETSTALGSAITVYLLSVAVFLPVSGWVADRFGARRVYCSAIAIFALGSLICGTSESFAALMAGRLIQGMGGALMTPVGRLIVVRSFPKERLLVATNYMIAPALVGSMLGPVLGGFITTYFSWRWNFFINVPISVIGLALTLRYVKDATLARGTSRFDAIGFVFIASGLASAQLAVEYLGRPGASLPSIVALFVASASLFAAYIWYARRRTSPLLDLGLFRARTFAISVLVGGISRIAVGALPFLLPLLFQLGFGLDPFRSGLLTVASALGVFSMRIGVSLALRVMAMKTIILANTLILSAIVAGLAFIDAGTPHWAIFGYLFLLGAVRSVEFSNITALGYADMTQTMMSAATTIITLTTRFCLCFGVGLGATLLGTFSSPEGASQAAFGPVFLILAGTLLLTVIGFTRLRGDDGWQLSDRRPRP